MIKILWECVSLECFMVHPTISLAWQKIISGKTYKSAKSASQRYCTALENFPLRREKLAQEDESGLDGFKLFASTHYVSHLPNLKEKWNHLGDLAFEENGLSVRKRVWETVWKCLQGGIPLMIIFIRWYGPVHCWYGYLSMLLFFIMVIR